MSYQVLARKWRPQRFDDVVGQQAVTRTLRNALASGRLAQSFVFAGPRGVGKTTTARILARALNCEKGPTADPCGVCDACVEIAEGRDIDVLEIDAATHTGVDNVREVIIAGLGIAPVRNRYKVFIIDEVHQLSSASFNALLKSIEEPPPHVVFMMATTELDKIPETILSRSQVFEFRTIGTKAIADQLRTIVDAEKIAVDDDALQLIARDADGSMRDAQSELDQVIAFTGNDDRGRRRGDGARPGRPRPAARHRSRRSPTRTRRRRSRWPARAVEIGLRPARWSAASWRGSSRDLLVLSVDPSRVDDPEIAGEGERDRLLALAGALLARRSAARVRSADAGAKHDIRGAAQPRYHLEMALLRWIHLRKLVPIEDLIDGRAARAGAEPRRQRRAAPPAAPAAAAPPRQRAVRRRRDVRRRRPAGRRRARRRDRPRRPPRAAPRRRSRDRAAAVAAGRAGAAARSRATSRTRSSPRSARRRRSSTTRSSRRRRRSRSPATASTFTFCAAAARAARAVRAERALARIDRAAASPAGRSRSSPCRREARRRASGAGAARRRRRRPTRSRRCASRRSPTPACRRCSTCFPAEIRDVEEM